MRIIIVGNIFMQYRGILYYYKLSCPSQVGAWCLYLTRAVIVAAGLVQSQEDHVVLPTLKAASIYVEKEDICFPGFR